MFGIPGKQAVTMTGNQILGQWTTAGGGGGDDAFMLRYYTAVEPNTTLLWSYTIEGLNEPRSYSFANAPGGGEPGRISFFIRHVPGGEFTDCQQGRNRLISPRHMAAVVKQQ